MHSDDSTILHTVHAHFSIFFFQCVLYNKLKISVLIQYLIGNANHNRDMILMLGIRFHIYTLLPNIVKKNSKATGSYNILEIFLEHPVFNN